MKAKIIYPIAELKGSLTKEHYVRVVNGNTVVQHRPRYKKAPTAKQVAARRAFAEQYGKHR